MPMLLENFQTSVLQSAQKKQVDPVIVFTGKRNVSENDKKYLNALGALLSEKFPDFIFRAGNANGADKEFVANIEPSRLEIVPPYTLHRIKNIPAGANVLALDKIKVPSAAFSYFNQVEPGLYNAYKKNSSGRAAQKSKYLVRNLAMLYGFNSSNIIHSQASFVLYYDDLNKPKTGGTGFTIKAATNNNILACNQSVWQNWL